MTPPTFLTIEDVLLIHSYQIEHFGGDPAVLDRRLLESAVAQPQQAFAGEYLHSDHAAMAAAYLSSTWSRITRSRTETSGPELKPQWCSSN